MREVLTMPARTHRLRLALLLWPALAACDDSENGTNYAVLGEMSGDFRRVSSATCEVHRPCLVPSRRNFWPCVGVPASQAFVDLTLFMEDEARFDYLTIFLKVREDRFIAETFQRTLEPRAQLGGSRFTSESLYDDLVPMRAEFSLGDGTEEVYREVFIDHLVTQPTTLRDPDSGSDFVFEGALRDVRLRCVEGR
jgi:hypothetical protein